MWDSVSDPVTYNVERATNTGLYTKSSHGGNVAQRDGFSSNRSDGRHNVLLPRTGDI